MQSKTDAFFHGKIKNCVFLIHAMAQHILVVDDEIDLSETFSELLQMLGYSASYATSLETALSLMRSQIFDVVISDIHMPAGDGMRLRTLMLADECLRKTPFIYMTGKTDELPNLNEPFLVKPFSTDDVVAILEEVLPVQP
tara:strand:- start:45532 stop:45954 length:423 start_codon:yes stop_codon:yes gene_type:complete